MASDTKTLKATCLCGDAAHQITLQSTDLPLQSYFCACDSCRHMTGTQFLSCGNLPASYQPEQSLLDKLTPFRFSDRITQYFCTRCGAHMLAYCLPKTPSDSQFWDVMTGTLEKFDGIIDLKGYGYLHDTLDGGYADFMPTLNNRELERWPYDPKEGSQLPLHWRDAKDSKPQSSSDRLAAHCKCGGVRFYIARPSLQSTQASRSWPDLLIPHWAQSKDKKDTAHETWWLRANKTKFLAGLCSCDSCRLASGMEITSWAFVPSIDITLDAEGKVPFEPLFGTLKSYNSSKGVLRYFCSGCGAIVFFTEEERSKTSLLDVAVGLLSAPEGSRAESWFEWRTERVSFREDAVGRASSLVEGVEAGLEGFREKGYGRDGPSDEVREVIID